MLGALHLSEVPVRILGFSLVLRKQSDLQPVPAAFKRVGSKRHAPKPAATEIMSNKSERKQAKPKFCFWCFSKGHGTAECQASVFSEICESSEHVKQKCPITKAPKNVVQWVGHVLDGNSFFHIPHAPFKGDTDKKNAKNHCGWWSFEP